MDCKNSSVYFAIAFFEFALNEHFNGVQINLYEVSILDMRFMTNLPY